MSELDDRIRQFKQMADADPDNEMGHFSLARAYIEAGRWAEAEPSLTRVLELNPTHSKSYQLLGEVRVKLGKREEAIKSLKRGYEVAAERGDVMPRDGCAKALRELGVELPAVTTIATAPVPASTATGATAQGDFQCSRCGRPGGKLPARPFKGDLGEKVWARVCASCWREWIGMGTKVINEMGLQLADPRAQEIYDEHLKEFLQLND